MLKTAKLTLTKNASALLATFLSWVVIIILHRNLNTFKTAADFTSSKIINDFLSGSSKNSRLSSSCKIIMSSGL